MATATAAAEPATGGVRVTYRAPAGRVAAPDDSGPDNQRQRRRHRRFGPGGQQRRRRRSCKRLISIRDRSRRRSRASPLRVSAPNAGRSRQRNRPSAVEGGAVVALVPQHRLKRADSAPTGVASGRTGVVRRVTVHQKAETRELLGLTRRPSKLSQCSRCHGAPDAGSRAR